MKDSIEKAEEMMNDAELDSYEISCLNLLISYYKKSDDMANVHHL